MGRGGDAGEVEGEGGWEGRGWGGGGGDGEGEEVMGREELADGAVASVPGTVCPPPTQGPPTAPPKVHPFSFFFFFSSVCGTLSAESSLTGDGNQVYQLTFT